MIHKPTKICKKKINMNIFYILNYYKKNYVDIKQTLNKNFLIFFNCNIGKKINIRGSLFE